MKLDSVDFLLIQFSPYTSFNSSVKFLDLKQSKQKFGYYAVAASVHFLTDLRSFPDSEIHFPLVLTMALADINSNSKVLSNYQLEPVVVDGQCTPDMVMKGYIDIITNEEYKKSFIGILGNAQYSLISGNM